LILKMRHISSLDGLTLRDDVLLEIASFLSRRWSDRPKALVTFTEEANPKTSPDKGQIDFKSIVNGVSPCGMRQ
jgi:hypothetical protein